MHVTSSKASNSKIEGKLNWAVSCPFNSSNHSISDFTVLDLSIINGDNDCRKTKECD